MQHKFEFLLSGCLFRRVFKLLEVEPSPSLPLKKCLFSSSPASPSLSGKACMFDKIGERRELQTACLKE